MVYLASSADDFLNAKTVTALLVDIKGKQQEVLRKVKTSEWVMIETILNIKIEKNKNPKDGLQHQLKQNSIFKHAY